MLIYYCYSCSQYFKVTEKKAKNADTIICPECNSFDTEHSPEEENNSDIENDYDEDPISDEDSSAINEYATYLEEVEGNDEP